MKKVKLLQGFYDEGKPGSIIDKFEDNVASYDFPFTDVVERADTLLVFMEMPGVETEDFTVFMHDDFLVIEGVRKKKTDLSQVVYLRMERQAFNFKKVIHIELLNTLKLIKAVLKDGVLTLEFKKNNSECIIEITEK